MITVSVVELFLKSAELLSDGYQKVELSELEGDNEFPAALSFEALDDGTGFGVDYGCIEDLSDSNGLSVKFSLDSIAPYAVSFSDLTLTSHAFHNAIENCKTCLDDKTISAELRSEITDSLKRFESYVNDLDSFLRDFIRG